MRTHADIVKSAGDADRVAKARGVTVHAVRSWIARNSIPAEHWKGFVEDGNATFEEMADAAAARRITYGVAICGACERRADDLRARACERLDCPNLQRRAA